MITSKTPFRISFFGGGTDYPAWYLKEGGRVLSATIDKYCYVSCRYYPPFFVERHRIVWSYVEMVGSIKEILHPAVREGLGYLGFDDSRGIEIHHQGDLPARAGMGSSSSFAVGLINALTVLQGRKIGKRELAKKAINLEQNHIKDCVGSQDQVAAAFGGLNVIEFRRDGTFTVEPLDIPKARLKELSASLLLVYAGTSRLASEIARSVVQNVRRKKTGFRKIYEMVGTAAAILKGGGDLNEFGELLDRAWSVKRALGKDISNAKIDDIYKKAISAGALGGKLLGAGSTGFVLFFVPPGKRDAVKHALSNYLHVPFNFESRGSRILYNSLEDVVSY